MPNSHPDQVSPTWKAHVDNELANLAARSEAQSKTLASIDERLDTLIQEKGKTNWPLIFGAATILASIIWGIFYALSSTQENARLQSQITLMEKIQPVLLASENSKADRDTLNQRVEANSNLISDLSGKVDSGEAALKEQLAEIETQFKSVNNLLNMRSAENQRVQGILWQEVMGYNFPDVEFWPEVHRNDR